MTTANALAFDRASARSYDADNRLHVASTNISKANICGYLGKEIPDFEKLGLDAETIYQLYRDPEELAKAAPTFNNLPLLSQHVPVSAENHQPDLVIGSTGTDAEFVAPYLKNSLVIWAQGAIDAVEAETQKELSSAYRYRADMTPGIANGQKYDGVMRDIIGNHVALVQEGRAGPDVVVGDAAIQIQKETDMAKIKLPKGATAALFTALKPKLAQDATLADFHTLIDSLTQEEKSPAEDKEADTDIDQTDKDTPPANPEGDQTDEALDGEGLSDEEEAQYQALLKRRKPDAAKDEDPAIEPEGAADEDGDKDKDEKDDKVAKPAMDAALAAQEKKIVKRMQDAMEAREFVRPHVGNLPFALDSAESVLRAAAVNLGIPSAKTVHESALRDLISFKVAAKPAQPNRIAQDAAGAKSYAEMFPGADKIGRA